MDVDPDPHLPPPGEQAGFAPPDPHPPGGPLPGERRAPVARNDPRRTGFDVVLGNPPWEMLNLIEKEHFADVPEIRDAPTGAARKRLIEAWRNGNVYQRERIAQYDRALYQAEAASRFIHSCGRFPLSAVGRLNTYALFAELARSLLAPAGRAGIIIQSGIATDDTNKAFFGDLVMKKGLVSFYDFVNTEGIFPGIHRTHPHFCAMTITRQEHPAPIQFAFYLTRPEHLIDQQRVFSLTPADLALINPNTRTAPVFRTRADADLTKRLYCRAPVLINERSGENPWGVSFRQGLFNMTSDSHLFHTAPGAGLLPLYEAKLLHQFTHRWATYAGVGRGEWGAGSGLAGVGSGADKTRELTPAELADPTVTVTPRYWVAAAEVEARLATRWQRRWLLGFRDITNATNERTAIFSLLPRVGVGHTAPLILFAAEVNSVHIACFLATVNSLVFDFATRQKVGGTHLTYTYLNQLPILPPSAFTPADIAFIVPRVLELVYTAWDMRAFAEDVREESDEALRALIDERWQANYKDTESTKDWPHEESSCPLRRCGEYQLSPFIWHEARRAVARAELDARIARLYGLTRDELRYILDPADIYGPDFPGETFRVLKEKELKLYGEYRTRRLVLEAWDREERGADSA